jgi:RNA polymerase sigma-70 factor (ECF subfamily)
LDQEQETKRFYDLVWPHRAVVLRAARMLARNPADADDLAQETLIKAFRKIGGFREGSDMKAWLFTVLRNTWIDRFRATASERGVVSLDEQAAEPAAALEQQDQPAAWDRPGELLEAFSDQQVIDALHGLSDEIRWTLLLVDVEGLSQADAAEVMQTPIGTIKSRVHRGHRILWDQLLPLARDRRIVRE